jgi:hypothetical protein
MDFQARHNDEPVLEPAEVLTCDVNYVKGISTAKYSENFAVAATKSEQMF